MQYYEGRGRQRCGGVILRGGPPGLAAPPSKFMKHAIGVSREGPARAVTRGRRSPAPGVLPPAHINCLHHPSFSHHLSCLFSVSFQTSYAQGRNEVKKDEADERASSGGSGEYEDLWRFETLQVT